MPTFLASQPAIAPGVTGSWQEVDVSAYCPAGTTGVILRCWNGAYLDYNLGYRKKGSSDDRHGDQNARCQCWVACGVDANRVLELYIGHAEVYIWLVGYFGPEAVFFTNGIDKSVGTAGSWQDVDISADLIPGDSACLAFLEFSGGSGTFGVRKKGSDAPTATLYQHRGGVTGLDVNNHYETWIPSTSSDAHLLGYLKAGAVVADLLTVVTPGSTDWVDLAALPAGAIGGIYQLLGTGSYPAGMRANGASETTYAQLDKQSYAMVGADASGLVEARITSTSINIINQLGYFTDLPTPAITNLSSASGYIGDSVTITGTGFNASQGTGSVTFNGTTAVITSWTNTSIVCTVPVGATTGNIVVKNLWGNASTGTAYTVKSLPAGASSTPEVPIHTDNPIGAGANLGLSPVR